jgi:hypothetical protein
MYKIRKKFVSLLCEINKSYQYEKNCYYVVGRVYPWHGDVVVQKQQIDMSGLR